MLMVHCSIRSSQPSIAGLILCFVLELRIIRRYNSSKKCLNHEIDDLTNLYFSQTLQENFSLLLEPKSLLILRDELYTDYLHSIEDITEDIVDSSIRNLHLCQEKYITGQRLKRSVRLSFTIRHVPRCSNFKLRF